jgi:hypothetical protein
MNQSRTIQPGDAIASANVAIITAILDPVDAAIHAATDLDTRNAVTPFPFRSYILQAILFSPGIDAIHAAINAGRGEQ